MTRLFWRRFRDVCRAVELFVLVAAELGKATNDEAVFFWWTGFVA